MSDLKIITDEQCTSYTSPGHPEKPVRISRTQAKLREQTELNLAWGTPGVASDESILRAHAPELLKRLEEPVAFDEDTPFHPGISGLARASVGAALEGLRCARNGEIVFSLMRPPGHHATRRKAMGFCYLNNVAIAALEALATGTRRVAVFDFDVHHGNGTEDILVNEAGAAFYSIHQHPAYPGTGAMNVGNNCFNYPLPEQTPRAHYREVLASALEELGRFQPELVAVSAGFDAYARDPLAQETLEAEDFHWLGGQLRGLGKPLLCLLEGGYSRDLPGLVFAFLKGLAGK
ncbi:MAG TPA: histone deacetylase [Verrucomicrobiae bacterium]|nr:histone deacetylase [Verrucomicrobiae bacterium]